MKKMDKTSKGEIVIYKSQGGNSKLEVKLEENNIWLNQAQIAMLFDVDRSVVTKHIKNIFASKELKEKSNVQKMHKISSDKPIKLYSLDAIISVGYRVNSKRATQFRIWATKILHNHLTRGYTINKKRLVEKEGKFIELKNVIKFLEKKAKNKLLSNQTQELISLLSSYTKSLSLLEKYDREKIELIKKQKPKFILQYNDCLHVVASIKKDLLSKEEASKLFGREINNKFESVIKNLYQTYRKKELYYSLEEKAANLLYLIIKDHPFVDGNKRIASFMFVYFLDRNKYLFNEKNERKIDDNALAALALLIAISDPKDKEMMINMITNLIK